MSTQGIPCLEKKLQRLGWLYVPELYLPKRSFHFESASISSENLSVVPSFHRCWWRGSPRCISTSSSWRTIASGQGTFQSCQTLVLALTYDSWAETLFSGHELLHAVRLFHLCRYLLASESTWQTRSWCSLELCRRQSWWSQPAVVNERLQPFSFSRSVLVAALHSFSCRRWPAPWHCRWLQALGMTTACSQHAWQFPVA